MTISREYLYEQLERAVESRLDALKTFHMRDGAVQTLQLLLDKLDEPEPAEPAKSAEKGDDLSSSKFCRKKFPLLSPPGDRELEPS